MMIGGRRKTLNKLCIVLAVIACTGSAQVSHFNGLTATVSDSLADVFPLAVGNQWTYSYHWTYHSAGPVGTGSYSDTGTVTIQIISRTTTADSSIWFAQENRQLWIQYDTDASYRPITSIDTIELVEILQGRHRLYRTGNTDTIIHSVIPFLPSVDTIVYRYSAVDSTGIVTFGSRNIWGEGVFDFNFKQGVGLTSVQVTDGCTCMWGYGGTHTLKSHVLTGVHDAKINPLIRDFQLFQNYPNPFNPTTTISFSLPRKSYVSLKIFDVVGREVATLVSEDLPAGKHTRQWNAEAISSGMYFYRMQATPAQGSGRQAGSSTITKKLLLLK